LDVSEKFRNREEEGDEIEQRTSMTLYTSFPDSRTWNSSASGKSGSTAARPFTLSLRVVFLFFEAGSSSSDVAVALDEAAVPVVVLLSSVTVVVVDGESSSSSSSR